MLRGVLMKFVYLLSVQVKSMNSSSSSTCANESTCWDRVGDADICSVVNLPVATPENLYLMGKNTYSPDYVWNA